MVDTPAPDHPLCANCGAELLGRFCHLCGEKRLGPGDRSFRHYLEGLFAATLHFEGKLWKTLRALIVHPGLLTLDYWRGRRVPYMKPLPLFLVVNLVYFLLASWQGLAAVPFNFVLRRPSNVALVERKLAVPEAAQAEFQQAVQSYARTSRAKPETAPVARSLQAYGQRYDTSARVLSRSLILVLIAMYTPLLALLQIRRRRRFPLVAHLVFATHFMTVFLLAFLATEWFWRLLGALMRLVHVGGFDGFRNNSFVPMLPTLTALAAFLYLGLRRFYEQRRLLAAAKTGVLLIGLMAAFLAYQRLLFFVTLAFT